MNKSKHREFEKLWSKIEEIRRDRDLMKALNKLIKLTTS